MSDHDHRWRRFPPGILHPSVSRRRIIFLCLVCHTRLTRTYKEVADRQVPTPRQNGSISFADAAS